MARYEALRDAGVGYVLLNGGGSGGGRRGRDSLRRFARDIMPFFTEAAPMPAAQGDDLHHQAEARGGDDPGDPAGMHLARSRSGTGCT